MRKKTGGLADQFILGLASFEDEYGSLPGIVEFPRRETFVEQLIDSVRRVQYIHAIASRDICPQRADPRSTLFDPLKAALWHSRHGDIEEAYWLVFLSVHFGKHRRTGWRLARDVYGGLNATGPWNWDNIRFSTAQFSAWLAVTGPILQGGDGIARKFGNHRKYESIDSDTKRSTAEVVRSYVEWVRPPRTHLQLIAEVTQAVGTNPYHVFDQLFHSMNVLSFGRTGKFDYLTMLGKMQLALIEPGLPYLNSATGPLRGSRLLFQDHRRPQMSVSDLEKCVVRLGRWLKVGMQVMEDSLCNWQKSPDAFKAFRG